MLEGVRNQNLLPGRVLLLFSGAPLSCSSGKMMGLLMITLATAMRAAHVADFYMTKYLSKAQESLGSVLQPFISGMRRTEDFLFT